MTNIMTSWQSFDVMTMIMTSQQWLWCHDDNDYDIMTKMIMSHDDKDYDVMIP